MMFGSVCSGIEAASVAWNGLDWKAAWFAEIEPFPCAVLAHHYPDVPNLGDMSKLPGRVLSGEIEAPDVFCGGTPCQAFSVAGLRRSLDDARGNLSLVFCEIADAIDTVRLSAGDDPSIIFWENVPGVLSTSDNAFGCFLAGLAGEDDPLEPPGGKWTNAGYVLGPQRAVAWRVTDAQYFGVAQRRRRVFVVASAREGFDPAAVLFEFEGVRRDTAPSREAGEGAAGGAANGATGGSRHSSHWNGGVHPPLSQGAQKRGGGIGASNQEIFEQGGAGLVPDVVSTIDASFGRLQGCSGQDANHGHSHLLAQCVTGQVTHTLKAEGFDASEDGTGRGQPIVAFSCKDHGGDAGPISPTLRSMGHDGSHANAGGQVAVCFAENSRAELRLEGGDGQRTGAISTGGGKPGQGMPVVAVAVQASQSGVRMNDTVGTLDANYGSRRHNGVMTAMQVRRLTPRECERLQGFPDDYTLIPWRNKPVSECPDGPRYKALGNSWAVPNVRWIGERIQKEIRK